MREIALDTETTGFDPRVGDRIVEIGCIELENHIPTGRSFQQYVNPERDMPVSAFEVHGLSEAFLSKYPVFADIVDSFLEFVGNSPLIIHNAIFDLGFINAELEKLGRDEIPLDRAIDTVQLARSKFPGAQASLDALCRRFNIDLSGRSKHGALLDAELLATVYLELAGGRQPGFELVADKVKRAVEVDSDRQIRPARPYQADESELKSHQRLVAKLNSAIWES